MIWKSERSLLNYSLNSLPPPFSFSTSSSAFLPFSRFGSSLPSSWAAARGVASAALSRADTVTSIAARIYTYVVSNYPMTGESTALSCVVEQWHPIILFQFVCCRVGTVSRDTMFAPSSRATPEGGEDVFFRMQIAASAATSRAYTRSLALRNGKHRPSREDWNFDSPRETCAINNIYIYSR